jgi:hypothetical protein
MKTKLFFMALGALALASCSMDDPVVETQSVDANSINFRTMIGSRGSATTTASLDTFYVSCLNEDGTAFFRKVAFFKSGNTTDNTNLDIWTSYNENATDETKKGTKYLWGKTPLRFYAFSPLLNLDIDNINDGTEPYVTNYGPDTNVKKQHDFIFATNKGSATDFAHVPLTFEHAYAQIVIKAKCGNSTYTVKVKGARVGYVNQKGYFHFPTPVTSSTGAMTFTDDYVMWDNLNTPASYDTSNSADAIELNNSAKVVASADGSFFVIPQKQSAWTAGSTADGAYLAVLVQINDKEDSRIYPLRNYVGLPEGYGYACVPINADWKAGKKYTYVLNFTDGAGKVDPEKPEVDPDNPGTEDPDPDPYDGGDDILGHAIDFTLTVTDWEDMTEINADMDQTINGTSTTDAD